MDNDGNGWKWVLNEDRMNHPQISWVLLSGDNASETFGHPDA